jgi:metal-responsive CopG/Arc/MetJ family transcriptional regulator
MSNFKPTKQIKSTEKSVISIRLDNEILKTVDEMAVKTDISRNEFIVQCIEYALKNMN